MPRHKKKLSKKTHNEPCFQELNTRKPCRKKTVDDKYQKKITEQRKNPKNKKKKVRPKTKEEKEAEEYYTPVCEEQMFLSLPRRIQATSNPWKSYWDTMVQKDISRQLSSVPLCFSTLDDYAHLLSLQKSLKMLAFSKIIISECNSLNVDIFEIIQATLQDIDTSRYQERLFIIEKNEQFLAERERIEDYRERITEYHLNSELWF